MGKVIKKQKLLMVGSFSYYIYEQSLCEALSNDFQILKYILTDYRFSSKLLGVRKVNRLFLKYITNSKPDVIFFYRTNMIMGTTIKKIKKENPEIKILVYHNDNPYLGFKRKIKYYFFLSLVPYADIVYCYRKSNLGQAIALGAKRVELFLPHFCSKIHYKDPEIKEKEIDVVFVGHYEDDKRVDYIDALIQSNIDVRIYGNWAHISKKMNWPDNIVHPNAYEQEYRKVIAKSKLALCFLSKHNADGYTRRCFEIPAIGTTLMSEYTVELSEMFVENEEIIFFDSPKILVTKVKKILENPDEIKRINENAIRSVNMNCSEYSRAQMIKKHLLSI